jgi:hypothetical protein
MKIEQMIEEYLSKEAGEFMSNMVNELAKKYPHLCDESGRGFWPVAAYFPLVLSTTLDKLQSKITNAYLSGTKKDAEFLAQLRIGLMEIVYEGDLGENHTQLYLSDHPNLSYIPKREHKSLPFYDFCQGLLKVERPIILLGAILRNEEGSVAEVQALVDTHLIKNGFFAQTHLKEEEKHARISRDIVEKLVDNHVYKRSFLEGYRLHDVLYQTVINV